MGKRVLREILTGGQSEHRENSGPQLIAASSKPPAANSRRHRHGTGCAALPHPSTKLPPRKTARSHALTIEMGAPEARPPTAPESWLWVDSAPPLGIEASTTSHPTPQVGSERDSAPDTARAQTPYPSDRTGPPRSSPHTITHRQIECLSQADSTVPRRVQPTHTGIISWSTWSSWTNTGLNADVGWLEKSA